MIQKIISRKFIVTLLVMLVTVIVPIIYKKSEISDSIIMTVLAIVGGIGVAYGVVNVFDRKIEKNGSDNS